MKKILFLIAASLSLTACPSTDSSVGGINSAPAPLAQTTADEYAIDYGIDAVEIALTSLDKLMDAGKITPGSAKAKKIANVAEAARTALNAAASARKAGSTTNYVVAMSEASAAFKELKTLF